MASSIKQFSLLLLLITISSSLHTHARDTQFYDKVSAAAAAKIFDKRPIFLHENDLYAQDSSQLPPSTTTSAAEKPLRDYFPKNYNPGAYATEQEENSFTSNNYGGGGATYNGGGFQPQGMSDTRFMENGKYFYDVYREKYSGNHPYQRLREDRTRDEYYSKNFFGNVGGKAYDFNGEAYQFRDAFVDEGKYY